METTAGKILITNHIQIHRFLLTTTAEHVAGQSTLVMTTKHSWQHKWLSLHSLKQFYCLRMLLQLRYIQIQKN